MEVSEQTTTHENVAISRELWVPDRNVQQCFNCYREFSLVVRKHHCRICGHIFCSICSFTKKVLSKDNKRKKIRICFRCDKIHSQFQTDLKLKMKLITNKKRIDQNTNKHTGSLGSQDPIRSTS